MNREILMLVDVMSKEKNVDKELVFDALESALAHVLAKRSGVDAQVSLSINRLTGEYTASRLWMVVPDEAGLMQPDSEMLLFEALEINPDAKVGEYLQEPIEAIDFGRIGAQNARQAIMQRMRDAEREQLLRDFLERNEQVVYGTVKRIESNFLVVEIGRLDAILRKDHMIPRENFRVGDRVKAFVVKAEKNNRGVQIELSRTVPAFMEFLFEQQVPEIEKGLLEIVAVARDPGVRAKLAVRSFDRRVDARGTIIGIRGSRVQAVTNELAGEKVDVILWSEEPAQFVIESLAPATVDSIVVDEDKHEMDVVVDEANLAVAIGRSGQNVRLASELTGWQINILTASEASARREQESLNLCTQLMEHLDIDQDLASLLVDEGFVGLEEILYVEQAELLALEGFDVDLVNELRSRALSAIEKKQAQYEIEKAALIQTCGDMSLSDDLLEKMIKAGIKTREDIADLAADECAQLLGIDEAAAVALVLDARKIWLV
jgi:N utilization substance protein A